MIKNKLSKIFSRPEVFIYIYFFAFTLFLAIVIKFGTAPDEGYHYNFIKYYAENSVDPSLPPQSSDFSLGSINTEVSYLYHYLMSFVYRLADAVGLSTVVALKFVNILLGIGTLIGLNFVAKSLKITKKARLAVLFLIANIPMFMFISASISYDNLVILLTVLGVATTLSLQSNFSLPKLIGLSSIVLLGPVTKKAFLPLSIVFGLFVVYCLYKNRLAAKKQLASLYKNSRPKFALLAVAFVIPLSMFSAKYAGNVLSYGSIEPPCNAVLTHKECLSNPIYSRSQTYDSSHQTNKKTVSEDIYLVSWIKLMAGRTYGLFGHKKFEETSVVAAFVLIVVYTFIILFFRRISWRSFKSTIIPILFIVYIAALLYTNYQQGYQKRGDIALAVQGRYAFPVLLPLILFVAHLYNRTLNKKSFQYGLIIFAIIFSVVAGPLYIMKGIDPSWLNYGIL